MSTSYVLIVFALVIVLMIVLISKCKVNAAMGILLSAFILAIALGTPWQDIEGTINSGFSSTIKSVAIVIFLGCTMGTVLEKTGAAIRITKWAIGLVGEKHMIWAIALSSAILGIPIWADTVVILLIPIVSMLAVQTKKSMMSYGTALYLGALVTASLVPPTPGPVSAAALLNVPLGSHRCGSQRDRGDLLLYVLKNTGGSQGGIPGSCQGDGAHGASVPVQIPAPDPVPAGSDLCEYSGLCSGSRYADRQFLRIHRKSSGCSLHWLYPFPSVDR